MSKRDPRMDPVPGDKLRGLDGSITVVQYVNGKVVHYSYKRTAKTRDIIGDHCHIDFWREDFADTTILRRAKDTQ